LREDQIKDICLKFGIDPNEVISKMKNDRNVKEIVYHEKHFFVVKPKMEGKA